MDFAAGKRRGNERLGLFLGVRREWGRFPGIQGSEFHAWNLGLGSLPGSQPQGLSLEDFVSPFWAKLCGSLPVWGQTGQARKPPQGFGVVPNVTLGSQPGPVPSSLLCPGSRAGKFALPHLLGSQKIWNCPLLLPSSSCLEL